MIIKFDFKKEYEKLNVELKGWISDKQREIESKNEKMRMNEISFISHSDDFEDVTLNANFRSIMATARLEDLAFKKRIELVHNFAVSSIKYLHSIISEVTKAERVSSNMIYEFFKDFITSEKEKDFIKFWVLMRNTWAHNSKFAEDLKFIGKYFNETNRINIDTVVNGVMPFFEKVNKKYPGVEIFDISLDNIPRI